MRPAPSHRPRGLASRRAFALVALAAAVVLAAIAAGCGGERRPATSGLRIAVSVPPEAWLVEAIGGDRVEVISLVGSGDSPETYQPADARVSDVLAARVYFRVGVPFENGAWFRALGTAPGLEVVDLRRDVPMLRLAHGDAQVSGEDDRPGAEASAGEDPHLWLSPRRLAVAARTVAETLARIDPENAALYDRNLASTLAVLTALDAEIAATLAPYAGRAFFVFHPAWGYFADDYDLEQVAIEIDGKDPADAELTHLQQRARAEGVTTVFVQPQNPGRAAGAVAAAVGARVVVLDPLAPDLPANLRRAAAEIARSFTG